MELSSIVTQVQQKKKVPKQKKNRAFGNCMMCQGDTEEGPEFDQNTQKIKNPQIDMETDIDQVKETPVTETQVDKRKKLLILDLDETLVHSTFNDSEMEGADIRLDLTLTEPSITKYKIGVYVRPHLEEFLNRMSQIFELYIFTASLKVYCDAVMDKIDPQNRCTKRLYRNDCTQIGQIYIKDVSKFGYELKDVIIMDNSALSFQMHKQNGLLCPEFFNDMKDVYLKSVIPFMVELSQCADVRKILGRLQQ